MAYMNRHLSGNERQRWLRLIYIEAVLLVLLIALVIAILIIGAYYVHLRIFTDAAVVIVLGALTGEITRRMKALFKEWRNHDV